MKMLMLFTESFAYAPAQRNSELADENASAGQASQALVAFVQAEEHDEQSTVPKVEKKLTNALKWAARKNETQRVVLHSFAHLSSSKAGAEFTRAVFEASLARLLNAGYEASQTPFGYFLDLSLSAPGNSQARLFHEF